ncbi:hypothetical protein PF006_g26469 [Phytophthora fragariae]|uniref:Uncharacterized protein n=1 Tax=Phytophthora fragariae TaxID=53985 RepID=A0A6A3QW46_9STRA|nr:hypothetical protein PF006_g26469 [Phytophthora fragariae]
MNGPRRIYAKPSFQNLLCRANIGPQGDQAQRHSGQGGASSTARSLRQPGPASLGAGWCFPQIKIRVRAAGGGDNRAQRDVVLPLQQGPQGNRAERRSGRGDTSTTTRA